MTIVVVVTKDYYEKATPLFQSLKENWPHRVCLLCIGWTPPNDWGFEIANVGLRKLPSYRDGWPENREKYVAIEGGDFLPYFDFEPDEKIIKLDADMVMQRPMTPYEEAQINCLDPGDIAMCPGAYPTAHLREEFFRLQPKRSIQKIRNDFPGNWGLMNLYCCGMIVCDALTYRKMNKLFVEKIEQMVYDFGHHAASQWLFNYIVHTEDFKLIEFDQNMHNGIWFFDTGTYDEAGFLYDHGGKVLFNHTKFLKDYSYK